MSHMAFLPLYTLFLSVELLTTPFWCLQGHAKAKDKTKAKAQAEADVLTNAKVGAKAASRTATLAKIMKP